MMFRSFVYGHELMEVLSSYMILSDFIRHCQHSNTSLKLIVFHEFTHQKLLPLLNALNIHPNHMPHISIYQKELIIHSKLVILPILGCLYINQRFLYLLHKSLKLLPFSMKSLQPNKYIVLYDRRKLKPNRDVPEGNQLESFLREKFIGKYEILLLNGTETLHETIMVKIF